MSVEEKSFVLVSYTAWVLNGEEKVIDTTSEEVAREAGIYREGSVYEPELVVVGEKFLLEPVEKALVGMKEGEEKEIILEPKDAFGERDPKKIRILSARELTRRNIIPRVGEEVEINGQRGRIIRVGAGRVVVDFNHPYAGRKVKFHVKVEKIITDDAEKLRELFHRWFRGIPRDEIKVRLGEGEAEIEVPPTILSYEGAHILIQGFTRDVEKYFEGIGKVKIVIVYQLEKASQKSGGPAEETAAEAESGEKASETSETGAEGGEEAAPEKAEPEGEE